MMCWYFYGLVAFLVLTGGYGYQGESSSQPADEIYMTTVFNWIQKHQAEILVRAESLLKQLRPEIDVDHVISNIRHNSRSNVDSCEGCKFQVEILNSWINVGLKYADTRDILIEFCAESQNEDGYLGDISCPGTADRYYPHAFYILSHAEFTSTYVCEKFNECDRDSTYQPNGNRGNSHITYQQPMRSELNHNAPIKPHNLDDAIKMIIMSDIHVEAEYLEGSATDCGLFVCCRGDPGQGEAGRWGDFHCNVPPRTTEALLQEAASLNPEFIVYTGDSPPHVRWLETLTSQIGVTEWLTSAFTQHVSGVPVFPCIGNHEIYPADMYYTALEDIKIWNAAYAENWQPVADFNNEQISTLRQAGYYTKLIMPGLRILTFNSNYGYIYNWYNLLNEFEPEYLNMVAFIDETLSSARAAGEKVILMSHQPHGDKGHILEDADILNPLIRSFSDVIVLHPIGHLHRDDFKLFLDPETGEAKNVQIMNQAMQTYSFVNPGFRVVYLDPVTFVPLDYEQYTMDLSVQQSEDPPEIKLLYTASSEYDLPDLTPQSYADLVNRFEDDDDLFQRFYSNMNSHSMEVEPCIGDCKHERLCWFRNDNYVNFKKCVAEEQSEGRGFTNSANLLATLALLCVSLFVYA